MRTWGIGVVLAVCVWSSPALGEERSPDEAPRHYGGQRSFGFGPSVGFYSGAGGLVTFEAGPIGAVVSGGYYPVIAVGNEKIGRGLVFDYHGSGQITADLLIGPLWKTRKIDIHLMAGYRYNSVLGHGFGAGARVAWDLSRTLRLEFHGAPSIFVSADERLRERGFPDDADLSLPQVQGGIGIALVVYP